MRPAYVSVVLSDKLLSLITCALTEHYIYLPNSYRTNYKKPFCIRACVSACLSALSRSHFYQFSPNWHRREKLQKEKRVRRGVNIASPLPQFSTPNPPFYAKMSYIFLKNMRLAAISALYRKSGSRSTTVTSDFRPDLAMGQIPRSTQRIATVISNYAMWTATTDSNSIMQLTSAVSILQYESKHLPLPQRFTDNFSQRLRTFKQNFTRLLHVCTCIYAKLQGFIQLSLTLTKLCHIKRHRLANFYISLELFWLFNLVTYAAPVLSKWRLFLVIFIADMFMVLKTVY